MRARTKCFLEGMGYILIQEDMPEFVHKGKQNFGCEILTMPSYGIGQAEIHMFYPLANGFVGNMVTRFRDELLHAVHRNANRMQKNSSREQVLTDFMSTAVCFPKRTI